MWAPSIVEKDGWYYLFFGANDIQNDQQVGGIGVARVAARPTGPFKDYLGKPLIDKFHNGAQPIDQFVFKDCDGTLLHRLRRLAALQHREAQRRLHRLRAVPRRRDVQGDHAAGLRRRRRSCFMKDGKYYFMWSEGGWTGPELRGGVRRSARRRSGRSSASARFCSRIPTVATGAGHHSVLHAPTVRTSGTSSTTAVRSARPIAIIASSASTSCEFDDTGMIRPVKITAGGVAADPVR